MADESTPEELAVQAELHDAIEHGLQGTGDLDDRVLTGWVVIWETVPIDEKDSANCGSFYGPRGMTTWRSLGLIEWARRFTLGPGEEPDE